MQARRGLLDQAKAKVATMAPLICCGAARLVPLRAVCGAVIASALNVASEPCLTSTGGY